jgi:4a-hydroxytetrahydrobiopterin dehydratase
MENISKENIISKLTSLPGWKLDGEELCYEFVGRNFIEAWVLMSQVAFKAEEMNHHPDWRNVYNKLTIRLRTHETGGITQLDLDLARFICDKVKDLFNR